MAQDESDDIPRARPAAGRYRLIAGVVGACALGAGLGLWARPSDLERPGSPKPPPAPVVTPASADRRIPIVVDDSPAPIGKPLDVLSASPPRPAIAPPRQPPQPQPPAPEPAAPTRPPTGLVRVVAPVPGPMAPTPPRALAPAPPPEPEPVVVEKPAPPKPTAKAVQAKADAARLAKAAHVKKAAQMAAKAKAVKLAKAKARHDRAKAAHEVELARAAPPPKPRHGLMALAHAFAKLAPHHAKAEPAAPVETAEAKPERHHKASVHETRLAKAAAKTHPVRPDPTPLTARGAGPLRLASATTRCASPDPGEALACGDPTLGAAERRLSRAYHDAEAAGVPSSTLKQQQQRWIAARAAAAREAPWAVREVYQARIAELQDLVRDAKGD